jgi:hypothetical protein
MNSVNASWQAGAETITLTQEECLAEHPTLRFHRIDIGFIDKVGKVIQVEEVILEDREKTVITVKGGVPNGTVAVLPNYNDLSFIKIIFDNAS